MRFRQSLFWDVDPKKINSKRHAKYIIERILDFGNDVEVRWVWKNYSRSLLTDVVVNSRSLQPRSQNLWSQILGCKPKPRTWWLAKP